MQSKDLRIGNYVNYAYKLNPIELHTVRGVGNNQIWSKGKAFPSWEDKFEAIRLSNEWIENLGFKLEEDEGDVKFLEIGKFGVRIAETYEFYFYHKMFKIEDCFILKEIKFVHELQNLYFALTGEELELKSESKP